MTHGKVWIKSSEDSGAITSTTDHWLRKRFSPELMAMLSRMLSSKPEERPTAMEIVDKRPRHMTEGSQDLIFKHQFEEFFGVQKQLFALLPNLH